MKRLSYPGGQVNGRARSSPTKIPIYKWREVVLETDVPPLTKLICLTLATHLSEVDGNGWDLGVKEIMQESGLGNVAVARHLANAVKAGLLEIKRNYNKLGHRDSSTYIARVPAASQKMVLRATKYAGHT